MPAEHPTTDHGHGSSHLLARSLVTYSNERYEDRILPVGTPDDALDCAAGLYPGNPPDRRPPKDQRGAALGNVAFAHAIEPRFDEVAVTHADHGMREPPAKQHGLDMRRRSRHLHQAVISRRRLWGRLRFENS